MKKQRDWDTLIESVHQWQCETFPQAGAESKWHHLKEEIEELGDCLSDPSEIADCLLLLIGIAKVQGLDPFQCIVDKMAVNRERDWGKPDSNGVVKHIPMEASP